MRVLLVLLVTFCGLGLEELLPKHRFFAEAQQPGAESNNQTHFRICVPEVLYSQCQSMVASGHPRMGRLLCIYATDKIACIEKIVKDEADFMPLAPEEIYVASRFQKNGFVILGEIRDVAFAARDFQYEAMSVVRKSSGIRSISDLKGKRSCHTGFGRNAGWKVPFSNLVDQEQLTEFCEEVNAPTPERDLNAVGMYFGAACAPGAWVPEKDIDARLKSTYPKLCELCKEPGTCSKDDPFAGYEGALKCLTENEGDVAWTKMDAVEKVFHLKGSDPLPTTGDYEFLCRDGSRMPLTSQNPCSWGRRPWRAFIGSSRLGTDSNKVKDLQEQITLFRSIGQESARLQNIIPEWLISVLEFGKSGSDVEVNYDPHRVKTISPSVYLSQRNFTVTIEKPSCSTKKTIRFCVRSEVEKLKCTALRMASMGQRIIPGFTCILGESSKDCAEMVSRKEADVVVLSAKEADRAQKDLKLVPILSEVEETDVEKREESAPFRYAVAVIRSEIAADFRGNNISSLRGKRSCHGSIRSAAGWNVPLSVLRDSGEISGPTCGLTIEMSRYFGNKSCVPGALDPSLKMDWLPQSLCSLCAGDGLRPGKPETAETLCADNDSERYHGDLGALRCLQDSVADVAFLDHVGLHLKTIGTDVKLEKMRLLCPNGSVTALTHFRTCNWGKVSPQKVLARGGEESLVTREDARLSLLKAQDIFRQGGKQEFVLRLFGPYFGNRDLLFQDTSVGLCDELPKSQREKEDKLIAEFDYCTTSGGTLTRHLSSVLMILIATTIFLKL